MSRLPVGQLDVHTFPMSSQRRSHRLFFALWPSAATRQALQGSTAKLVARSGGRPVPPENFHITLNFLGSVPDSDVAGLKRVAESIRVFSFELQLGRVESWSKARVLCAIATRSPPQLNELQVSLMRCLSPERRELERRPFQPHVTLARQVPRASRISEDIEPIDWRAEDFVLVESHATPAGSRYEVLARWRLAEAG
jgi:2'-5' RNA ligase